MTRNIPSRFVRLERALMPFEGVRLRPGADLRGRFRRDYADVSAGLQEAGDFGFSDGGPLRQRGNDGLKA